MLFLVPGGGASSWSSDGLTDDPSGGFLAVPAVGVQPGAVVVHDRGRCWRLDGLRPGRTPGIRERLTNWPRQDYVGTRQDAVRGGEPGGAAVGQAFKQHARRDGQGEASGHRAADPSDPLRYPLHRLAGHPEADDSHSDGAPATALPSPRGSARPGSSRPHPLSLLATYSGRRRRCREQANLTSVKVTQPLIRYNER